MRARSLSAAVIVGLSLVAVQATASRAPAKLELVDFDPGSLARRAGSGAARRRGLADGRHAAVGFLSASTVALVDLPSWGRRVSWRSLDPSDHIVIDQVTEFYKGKKGLRLRHPLPLGQARRVSLSPDDRTLLFLLERERDGTGNLSNIVIVAIDAYSNERLWTRAIPNSTYRSGFGWSGDGGSIVVWSLGIGPRSWRRAELLDHPRAGLTRVAWVDLD